jgi:hypothetical protein
MRFVEDDNVIEKLSPTTSNPAFRDSILPRASRAYALGFIPLSASRSVTSGSRGTLVSLYADNGALYYEDHPLICGKNAIRDTWKTDFDKQDVIMSTLQEEFQTDIYFSNFLLPISSAYTRCIRATRSSNPAQNTAGSSTRRSLSESMFS